MSSVEGGALQGTTDFAALAVATTAIKVSTVDATFVDGPGLRYTLARVDTTETMKGISRELP